MTLVYYTRRSHKERYTTTTHARDYTNWVHAGSVTPDELESLAHTYQLDPNIIRDVRDLHELPRIEYGVHGTIYLFLRVPHATRHAAAQTAPLLLVITPNVLFTLAHGDAFHANEFAEHAATIGATTPQQLALFVYARVVSDYEELVHKTAHIIHDTGARLRSHEVTNQDFVRFVTIEDNLNEYTTNLDGLKALTQHMRENRRDLFSGSDLEMVDDIALHIQQLLVAIASQRQSVDSIRNAYTTIANNTLNQRMKTLTVLTVLIALPNVFYGMYGMNVTLPFADEPWAYAAVVVFTIIIILVVYALARRFKIF